MKGFKLGIALGGLLLCVGGGARAQIFTFENIPFNSRTGVNQALFTNLATDPASGLTATFTAMGPGGNIGFYIADNNPPNGTGPALFSSRLSKNFLLEDGGPPPSVNPGNDVLTITFNQPVFGVMFDFVQPAAATPLFLTADSFPTVPELGAPNAQGIFDGHVSYTAPGAFSSFTLFMVGGITANPALFGIDNLSVTPSVVPEPGALALAVCSGLPLAWRLRRRKA